MTSTNILRDTSTDEKHNTSLAEPHDLVTEEPGAKSISASKKLLLNIHTYLCILILFVNYFLAQYDKFILSYFQTTVLSSLGLSSTQYALLSGYATGIAYAVLALPIAYIADYTRARVWVLSVAALWWSLCVIFQGLSHNFTQVFLARFGMGIGQSCVEALSVSLISDLVGWRNVFLGESVFYVGVYVGEAVSGQIATAFTKTGTSWQVAMRAIGITGVVVAVLLRLLLREPKRQPSLLQHPDYEGMGTHGGIYSIRDSVVENLNSTHTPSQQTSKFGAARITFIKTVKYLLHMNSFWLIILSAGFRQLGGNVFGYYMPSYLSTTYPNQADLLSHYGIIVGTVGSVTVLMGGVLTSVFWHKTKLTPIYLTAIGGMISSLFVLLMIFSRDIANGSETRGVKILYGTMSIAYLTAELWLGALFGLIALLLPPSYKTFGLAIWSSVQVLIYSSGPEIIGLALRNTDPESDEYRTVTRTCLAVIIPFGYWVCGIGLLFAIPLLKRDLRGEFVVRGRMSGRRRAAFGAGAALLLALVVALFAASLALQT